MMSRSKQRFLSLCVLYCLLSSVLLVQGQLLPHHKDASPPLTHDALIRQGMSETGIDPARPSADSLQIQSLEAWLNTCPSIAFASRIESSITVKFIDGSYTVLMDLIPETKTTSHQPVSSFFKHYGNGSNTALLLNAAEYVYGHQQCTRIINTLLKHDYSIEYRANEAVTLSFLRHNLSADLVYMNTHAGYFDVDGDHLAESVVIATGEFWTNDTEQTYSFEYQNNMIVKGMVGEVSFIAFTPVFISYYYAPGDFSDSLVYMATCHATYDASMAQVFLDAGASAYIGWSGNTVFWTNSRISVNAIRLFSTGFCVDSVCKLIRSGGLFNVLFHSKLMYYGDGQHRIPR